MQRTLHSTEFFFVQKDLNAYLFSSTRSQLLSFFAHSCHNYLWKLFFVLFHCCLEIYSSVCVRAVWHFLLLYKLLDRQWIEVDETHSNCKVRTGKKRTTNNLMVWKKIATCKRHTAGNNKGKKRKNEQQQQQKTINVKSEK